MTSAADVLQMIKDNDVKYVDYRFTDMLGKEMHLTVPAHRVDDDVFELGQAFDGSSFAGWRGIEASDMMLLPDPATARMDPFREANTLVLTCDVLEPTTGKGYERDPRSCARRAEAYLKSTGIGDTAYFGPEPEFFIFDSVAWDLKPGHSFFKIGSEEAPWSSGLDLEGGNLGHRNRMKGGYFPVPPCDSLHDIRTEMCTLIEQQGVPVEIHHHEVAGAGAGSGRLRRDGRRRARDRDRLRSCRRALCAQGRDRDHLPRHRCRAPVWRSRHGDRRGRSGHQGHSA